MIIGELKIIITEEHLRKSTGTYTAYNVVHTVVHKYTLEDIPQNFLKMNNTHYANLQDNKMPVRFLIHTHFTCLMQNILRTRTKEDR